MALRSVAAVVASTTMAFTGVALSASGPSAVTVSASSIGQTSAELNGRVNPNGSATTYHFEWGLTNSYGSSGPATSAGNGTTPISVQQTASKLSPGTTYHFRLVATNQFGTSDGADHTFTTDYPRPTVTTGSPTGMSSSGATLTGTVNPSGQATSWYFEWGAAGRFSERTITQTVGPGTTPQTVVASLSGLRPGTVYQYRLVAQHPHAAKVSGPTALLMTYPLVRPYAFVTAWTRPRHRLLYPYTFTTTGVIGGPYGIPAQFACIGEVTLRFYRGGQQVRFQAAPVMTNCTYSAQTVFYRLPGRAHTTPVRLKVVVHFVSTPYLARSRAPIRRVTVGY